jgi:FdrA protein
MTTVALVKRSAYRDSVLLLDLARELRALPGVREAAALMATPANQELLAGSGLSSEDALAAGPNDLVIAIRAESAAAADLALARAEALVAARDRPVGPAGRALPRTLDSAWRRLEGANLALISVPGPFAAAEARRALLRGLHVMLFSDNVPVEAEIALKQLARRRGLLMMGPDCGTAYLAGVPLGFANAVPRGRVGLVAASGTGLQQVATLLADSGEGISHGIGVGGRDMSEAVGGAMALVAIDALAAEPATEAIVVVGKPPAPAVRAAVAARLRAAGKPAIACLLGPGARPGRQGSLTLAATLEDAARAAVAAVRGHAWTPRPFGPEITGLRERLTSARRALAPGQRTVRGAYAGGTLADEARLILDAVRSGVTSEIVDLGADEYTVRRAHPMIDPAARIAEIGRAAADPGTAVILLDVVLGHGAAADPAGDLAPALEAGRRSARAHGRDIALVATVVGTDADPQGMRGQIARLEGAGAWVLPSNAQAARAAACIAGGEPALAAILAEAGA